MTDAKFNCLDSEHFFLGVGGNQIPDGYIMAWLRGPLSTFSQNLHQLSIDSQKRTDNLNRVCLLCKWNFKNRTLEHYPPMCRYILNSFPKHIQQQNIGQTSIPYFLQCKITQSPCKYLSTNYKVNRTNKTEPIHVAHIWTLFLIWPRIWVTSILGISFMIFILPFQQKYIVNKAEARKEARNPFSSSHWSYKGKRHNVQM